MDQLSTVFARNCSARRIAKPEAAAFMNANHIYGDASCRYRYGLFVSRSTGKAEHCLPEGTLVAVAEFSSARKWQKGGRTVRSCEWIRYASLPGIRVTGGMGKLLQKFCEDVDPDDVMSYVDPTWGSGQAYEKLGFASEGIVERPGFTSIKYRLFLRPW